MPGFFQRCGKYIKPTLCNIPVLTGEMLQHQFGKTHVERAVGLDGWRIAELRDQPACLLDVWALLLNDIEHGGKWPDWLIDLAITMIPKDQAGEAEEVPHTQFILRQVTDMRPINNLMILAASWDAIRYGQMSEWREE